MTNQNDFDLDIQIKKTTANDDTKITSKIACTPGCVTGALMCATQSCVVISSSCSKC